MAKYDISMASGKEIVIIKRIDMYGSKKSTPFDIFPSDTLFLQGMTKKCLGLSKKCYTTPESFP